MKILLNPDAKVVKTIKDGLAKKDGYCPCRIARIEDNKCMCKEFRDLKEAGICHCGLYEKYVTIFH